MLRGLMPAGLTGGKAGGGIVLGDVGYNRHDTGSDVQHCTWRCEQESGGAAGSAALFEIRNRAAFHPLGMKHVVGFCCLLLAAAGCGAAREPAPSGGVVVEPSALDFGLIAASDPTLARVVVTNYEAAPIAAPMASLQGDFEVVSSSCAEEVAAAASCEFTVRARPQTLGAAQGALTLQLGEGTTEIPLSAMIGGRVDVAIDGDGDSRDHGRDAQRSRHG
jgi:hypothetical protein